LQHDLLAFFDGVLSKDTKSNMCQIVVDRVSELQKAEDERKEDQISIVWSVDDILMIAEDYDVEMSKEDARKILKDMDKAHDANDGITWDTIHIHVKRYQKNKEAK
jgi:hypothetical protein